MAGRRNRGFTLIELMVTLVLAFVIVGAIYLLYSQSVSASRVELQLLDMQDRLRFGLEHIKRDFRRTGFQATPNSNVDDNVCPKPATHLRAVTLQPYQDMPFKDDNPNISPTFIVLFGDFFSGRSYRTDAIQDNKVYLVVPPPPTIEGEPDPYPRTEVEFDRVFNPYPNVKARYLRIATQEQFEIFLPVIDADFDEKSVTLENSVPMMGGGSMCGVSGFGQGLEVNIAGYVRYAVLTDTRPNAPAGKTDLVREELQTNGTTLVPNSQLVIADYAIDIQLYDFGADVANAGNVPQLQVMPFVSDVVGGGSPLELGNSLTATPELLRFVTVKLTVRSMDEDPNHFYVQRQNMFQPLYGFELSPMEGGCRTATMASRVELSSLAVRNMQSIGP